MKYNKILWLILFFIISLSLIFLLKKQIYILFDQEDALQEPDFTISKISISDFDASGRLSQEIIAPHLQHKAKEKLYKVTKPNLRLNNTDKSYWTLDSDIANIDQISESVIFEGNVKLKEYDLSDKLLRTVETNKLIYYPKTKIAKSNEQIIFTAPGLQLHAGGAIIDLIKKTINLNNKTNIKYQPREANVELLP